MNPTLCQALLQAELSTGKGRALLKELGPFGDGAMDRLKNHPALSPTERKRATVDSLEALQAAVRLGVTSVGFSEYSEPLKNWQDNPPGLFVWGDWKCALEPTVAIVGTRGASTYGKAVSTKFAEAFAKAGVTVISGGAIGIDAAAHKGAIAAGGSTIAALAGGIDRLYPALHRGLFQQIRSGHGCLVSQFACGTKPDAYRFLGRNLLIAALSMAVVVVEAPERSGAIHTAHRANELGRQVFVVPSNIENLNFRGSHALIRDGAALVDHPDQVLSAINVKPALEIPPEKPMGSVAQKILGVLSTAPLAVEYILERSGLPMSDVISELTILELEGRIVHDSGGYALRP